MAASILVRDVITRASILLNDASPQFTAWTEAEMVTWFNDAQRAIAKLLPQSCARIDSILLVPGTRQSIANLAPASVKQFDGTNPAGTVRGMMLFDIIRNMGTDGMTPGMPILPVPRESLDNSSANWHSNPGSGVVDNYAYDPRTPLDFYVVPGVSSTEKTWVEIAYVAQPTDAPTPTAAGQYGTSGSSGMVISVRDVHADDLTNYIVARAFLKETESVSSQQYATMYSQLFINSLNSQVQVATGTNPNLTMLPFAPSPLAAAR